MYVAAACNSAGICWIWTTTDLVTPPPDSRTVVVPFFALVTVSGRPARTLASEVSTSVTVGSKPGIGSPWVSISITLSVSTWRSAQKCSVS